MILHLCGLDKFIEPFYAFVDARFEDSSDRHLFYIHGKSAIYKTPIGKNVFVAKNYTPTKRLLWLIKNMNKAEKIILHDLWSHKALRLLSLQPWLLKKTYWVIWGADLYSYQLDDRTCRWWRREIFRRFAIKRIGNIITHIEGDYQLAKKWYSAQGMWHECFMYPSNLYHSCSDQSIPHDGTNILVGNSADPSNNHLEILDKLQAYAGENIAIFCPLSYGNPVHAQKVADYGKLIFGDKFVALRKFVKFHEYIQLLSAIDVAIFYHQRQQGMGNVITLLGMQKKVYMRRNTSSWKTLENMGIKLYEMDDFSLNKIEPDVAKNNESIVSNYFSVHNLQQQMQKIFSASV